MSQQPSPYPLDVLAQQFPDLQNISYITSGGQKAVYAADHQHHGKIALKILAPGADAERFVREVAAVQSLPSQYVPQVHAHGQLADPHPQHHWLYEEWIEGITLRDKLKAGPVSNALALKIGLDVLMVLADAEQHHIVHRDIKPENIIISHDESRVWLIDFGIARHLDRTSLTAHFMPCSIGYSPIEQMDAHRHEIDSRSDLFSLGVTLYECVEGSNPFIQGATSNQEVYDRISKVPLPKLSRQVDVGGQLDGFISTMTQTQRNHRVGSAAEALAWMTEITVGGAV